MRSLVLIFGSTLVLAAMAACSKSSRSSGHDSGTASTDTDSDVDDDADTDTGSNTDTNTATDTDTNTDGINDGQLAWAKRAGGSSWDEGHGISALPDGSALVTGYFTVTATFGPDEIGETVLTADGLQEIYVAKYNADGTLAWAKRAGGIHWDEGNSISALLDGSALVAGSFSNAATFGPSETGETVLSSDGVLDVFVARYNPDGTLAWAKRAGGADWVEGRAISALPDGSALVTGWFQGTATFGPGEIGETALSSDGEDDIFVARYNPEGTLVWAKRAGGTNGAHGRSISTLSDGSALVTGWFQGTATFGPGETGETVLDSDGSWDIYVAKYNAEGTLAWAKRAGGSDWDQGYGISAISDGSALVTGYFAGTPIFGPGEINETVLSSDGGGDIFMARYNADGTLAWAKRAGGSDYDHGWGISALSYGSALVTGLIEGTSTFGLGETGETVLNSNGEKDIFVAKYNPDGTLAWAKGAGGLYWDYGIGISASSDGSALVTGVFDGKSTVDSAIFGQGETNETVLDSHGSKDIFVAKLGP